MVAVGSRLRYAIRSDTLRRVGKDFMTVEQLKKRVAQLEAGIKKHADQRDDDRCWEDDAKLYALIGIEADQRTAPLEVRMENCRRYQESRSTGETYAPQDKLLAMEKRIRVLENEMRSHDHLSNAIIGGHGGLG